MLLTSRKMTLLATLVFLCGCGAARALQLPRLFSDNMVLQQGMAVPIWGWGREGETITVECEHEKATTIVKDGRWIVRLSNLKAGGPYTLIIQGDTAVTLRHVLVGEVWLASGQSNMEFPLNKSFAAQEDINDSANQMIRLLHVPRTRSNEALGNINARWTECNPDTVSDFSAVAYYFARDLQKQLRVPVGIIEASWGGTPIEVWMEMEYLKSKPQYRVDVFESWMVAQDIYEHKMADYNQKKKAAEAAGEKYTNAPPRPSWRPGELFNGMIAPLVGYGMKGVIWYQGENNAGSEDDAQLYHSLLPDMIRNWRGVWAEGEFPFLIVQLAPFRAIRPEPSESSWASVREAQLKASQTLPNVGLAVITDVGDQHNIHPIQKEPVGARLALAARGIAYHQPIEYSGPVLKEAHVNRNEILLTFDHVGAGLETPNDEPLAGFSICGADGQFVWASAAIKNQNQVFVYSPLIKHPRAVRYGWADYPVANLWNKAGLPASPFRTDDFELR